VTLHDDDDWEVDNESRSTLLKRKPKLEVIQKAPAFPLTAFSDIKLVAEERNYIVKGLLPRSGLAVVWGPPKSGKSFWCMDILLHAALGWEYRGRKVQQANGVYVALEGRNGIPARVEAFKIRHEINEAPFHLVTHPLNLILDAGALIASIKAQDVEPGVVCLDTLNRSLVGSESKDEDMSAYIAAAGKIEEAFGCLVVIVHHCGVDATRPRGHTSLTGAVEVQLAVKKGDDGVVAVTVERAKDLEEGAEIFSKLEVVDVGVDPDSDPITSLVVVPTDAPQATSRGRKPSADQLTMYRMVYDAEPSGLTVEEWNEKARAEGIGVKRRAQLIDNRNALKDMNMVSEFGGRWRVNHQGSS
jgi:AAA domain